MTEGLEEKLELILRLIALRSVEGLSKTDAIVLLANAGLDRHAIADLVKTTPSMVSKTISTNKICKRK